MLKGREYEVGESCLMIDIEVIVSTREFLSSKGYRLWVIMFFLFLLVSNGDLIYFFSCLEVW